MEEGTCQGSPLSPTLWLTYIAGVLTHADAAINRLLLHTSPPRYSLRQPAYHGPLISVDLHSYADDVNPLIVTQHTTRRQHQGIVDQVDQILESSAAHFFLTWDSSKDARVNFGPGHRDHTTTLGILIQSDFSFQAHINARIQKATRLAQVMMRLGNANGGLSPAAARSLLTGAIRPIFTWGAELWYDTGHPYNPSGLRRIEYQALCKITGAYHGSAHTKLGLLANVEPIEDVLHGIQARWAGKACRTGDPHIQALLHEAPSPNFPVWHFTSTPLARHGIPIAAAFSLSPFSTPSEISWGDASDLRTGDLLHITLITPDDPRSKVKTYSKLSL